jgi:hypothetical protein
MATINLAEVQDRLASNNVFQVQWGLVYKVVCAPHWMPVSEVERITNEKDPTGISSPWRLAEPPQEGVWQGTNQLDCPECAGRKHYLMNC